MIINLTKSQVTLFTTALIFFLFYLFIAEIRIIEFIDYI